ncbi:unnamed protein product [Dracunculus medinensis]|uniref:Mitochondrial carrier protein n=1 Tax=Dracunculus medinensis TaxID=318479 RepID=A0A0N4UNS1_DRAME|nr:unnamed protein product [Dracunculus medinensis]
MATNFEHFIGGFAGGIASTLVCHPLDLLKIRFSANEGKRCRPQYSGYLDAVKNIYRVEGLRGLYRGLSPNLTGAALSYGFYFQFYFLFIVYFVLYLYSYHIMKSKSLTNPIWLSKTRLCLQYEIQSDKKYSGMVNCIYSTARNDGIKSLYKGFLPGLFGTSHGALQFMLYNYFKNIRFKELQVTFEYLLFSAGSKIIATSATFPYQVLRTLKNLDSSQLIPEGIRGFYKGLLAGNLRQLPAAIVIFLTYENVRHIIRNS